jgi:hypothetical protein
MSERKKQTPFPGYDPNYKEPPPREPRREEILLERGDRRSKNDPEMDLSVDTRELLFRVLQANLIHRQREAEQKRGNPRDRIGRVFGTEKDRRGRLRGLFGNRDD